MDNGLSPADVAAMSNNCNGFGDSWMGMLFLFALIFGLNGNGWGNNGFANAIGYENLATSNEVQRGFEHQNSMANEREILAAINSNSLQGMQNANQNTQYVTGMLNDKYGELARDIAGIAVTQGQVLANQNECCCGIKMQMADGFANQRYESAMQGNAIIQAVQAEGAATREMLQQKEINELRGKVNSLELQQAVAGVVRYPDSFTYSAGANPFCGCNYGYNM